MIEGFDLPGGESTAAALRRVEHERDLARAELARAQQELDLPGGESVIRAAVQRYEAELVRVRADLGAAWDDCRRVRADLLRATRDRDLARAELESARQELDALRTARDNLARTLGAACRRITELETT